MARDLHLVIVNKAYSSWSMRPWTAMAVAGLKFRETVIPLYQPNTATEIAKYSRAGKCPVLQHGDITVWESLAILDYLAEAFFDRHWWPTDPYARAMARSIATEMHSGFRDLRIALPMNLRRDNQPTTPSEAVDKDVARISAIWRDAREQFGKGGAFLFGEFSHADAMYAPVVSRFKTYGVKLDAVSQAYCEAILDLPAVKDWYAAAAREPWVIGQYDVP